MFFEKSTRWSICTAVARRFLISNTRSCESASRVKHSVSCHQTRALRIKIGGNITSHQQLHKPCKVTSRRVLSQKSRGVKYVPFRRQASADIYEGTESTTPARQSEPEVLKVSRLPHKKPRRQICPLSSPSFR